MDGWDQSAIFAYKVYVFFHVNANQTGKGYWQSAHLVGSKIYSFMLKRSKLTPKPKLSLMLNCHLQSFIDQNGFLQFNPTASYHLSTKLSPLSDFYPLIRQLGIDAYRRNANGLNADNLGQQLHLFRTYLDHAYLNFIRQYGTGEMTDYQRLCQFMTDHHLRADYTTGANFHNRYRGTFAYPPNMKVQLMKNSWALRNNDARMIEFIVNIDSESFVSEWKAYENHRQADGTIDSNWQNYSPAEMYQIANTESFNYGIPYGNYMVPWPYVGTHHKLDVAHPADPQLRRTAIKKYFPNRQRDVISGGVYANIVSKGGSLDVQAWQKVPTKKKTAVYHSYIEWIKQQGYSSKQVPGIDAYLQK